MLSVHDSLLCASPTTFACSVDIIRKFKECQRENPILRFMGACNDLHDELNACLKEQVPAYR